MSKRAVSTSAKQAEPTAIVPIPPTSQAAATIARETAAVPPAPDVPPADVTPTQTPAEARALLLSDVRAKLAAVQGLAQYQPEQDALRRQLSELEADPDASA